jgi:hypothetical protein
MKTPPDNPEFNRFTEAMREIVKVSKVEMQRRIEEEKRKPKSPGFRPAFRVPVSSSKPR